MYTLRVPPCLLVHTKQLASEDTSPGGDRKTKRPGRIPKKLKNQD